MPAGLKAMLLFLVACVVAVAADGHDHGDHSPHAPSEPGMEHGSGEHDGHEHGGHGGNGTESLSGPMPACAKDPTATNCTDYMYPEDRALMDVAKNCELMPFMVGCNLWEACKKGDMGSSNEVCEAFTLLAATCFDEGMSGMAGCRVHTPMCHSNASVVEQCDNRIEAFVDTMPSQRNIAEQCADHSMPGCDQCTGTGTKCSNTLLSLQTVCRAHDMPMCAPYKAMCSANPTTMEHFCNDPPLISGDHDHDDHDHDDHDGHDHGPSTDDVKASGAALVSSFNAVATGVAVAAAILAM